MNGSYWAAHWQLRRDLGPAKHHPCTDCPRPAADWSLNPWAQHPRLGQRIIRGRTIPAAYSMHTNDYAPRCKSCHIKLDRRTNKTTTTIAA